MSTPIEFYFDFSSPYGYLASTRIEALAAKHAREVLWLPFLVGVALKTTGRQPLAHTPMISDYAYRDLPRFARLLNVPLEMPHPFPLATVTACRAFYWLQDNDSDNAVPFAKAVYRSYFAEQKDISKVETLSDLTREVGADTGAVFAQIKSDAVKERFRERNDAAIAKGVFGSPTFIIDGEPFWGADRLDQVDRWLQTGGW